MINIVFCKCGCGQTIEFTQRPKKHGFVGYIKGHNLKDKRLKVEYTQKALPKLRNRKLSEINKRKLLEGRSKVVKPKLEKFCKFCNKVFYVYPSHNYVMFCSRKCRGQWLSKNLCGSKHPNFKGRISKICKVCGKEFIVATYYKNQIYCSTRCRRKQIKFVCLICNKEYFRRAYEKDISKVCSRACLTKFLKGKHLSPDTEFKKGRVLSEEHQKNMIKALHQKPNKLETRIYSVLNIYFPDEWKYVGSGDVILNGLCPDFIHQSKKLIIEVFGDVFHNPDKSFFDIKEYALPEYRIMKFEEWGYKTLILWESYIYQTDETNIVLKITEWLNEPLLTQIPYSEPY